jgi:glycosyltransferase involved in cell wall biosynthesis
MRIQAMVATMHQQDHDLLQKMNIQTDAIVGNQCDRDEVEKFIYREHQIAWYSFSERGVGLNRNNALMRANADIALFADDDMVYVENYPKIIKKAFEELPDADVIIFDLKYPKEDRPPIKKIKCLKKKECMRFGAARFAVRVSKIHLHGVSFNLCFGGGAKYSSGEDTLFLNDCIDKGLKVYSYPAVIAHLQDERESTWFQGYNDKFFFDRGVLYALIDRKFCDIFALYHCFKHRKRYSAYGWKNAWKQMRLGMQQVKKH